MEAPYTIASLPRPLDAEHGAIHASPVFGIKGSRKRKRHEVAVGIDGEGVNVYNIQSQSLVTSYALPTETYLCCPPCSIHVRRPKPTGAQRRTYLVLRSGPKHSKRRLVCLVEDARGGGQIEHGLQVPAKTERRLQDGDILAVEVVAGSPYAADAGLQILVSYRGGQIDCFDADLKTELWQHHDATESANPEDVEHIGLTDVETARKGLLASREDVVATLQTASGTGANKQQLLYRIVRSGSQRNLEVFSLRAASHDHVQSQKPGLQHLLSLGLPAPKHKSSGCASHEVHVTNGKAYQLLNGRLTVYDLASTLPRIATSFGSRAQTIVSFTRISGSAVLTVQDGQAVVYETKYGSVQASVALGQQSSLMNAGQKRKRTEDEALESKISWCAITSFADLGIIAGLCGMELMAVQVTGDLQRGKLARSEGPLLANVLGRGAAADLLKPLVKKAQREKLEEWGTKVDSSFERHDVAEIEALLAGELKLEVGQSEAVGENPFTVDSHRGGDEDSLEPNNIKIDTTKLDRKRTLYIVSKLFRISTDGQPSAVGADRLVATVDSETVYEWLALAGLLTLSNLQQAMYLRQDMQSATAVVRPGDIMSALAAFDNTFHLVHDLLEDGTFFDLAELVQALRLLIQSFETPAESTTNLLPAPTAKTNGDVAMANGDAESHADSEALAAERELGIAISALQSGLELRSETLRLVLGRLVAFPKAAVTKTMRDMMRQEELVFFMKILRLELLEGSWQQRYIVIHGDEEHDPFGPVEDDTAPSDAALKHISTLMSCTINAIGISGWLVGQSADVYGMFEFVQELKAEVSASMEGVYENDTLSVFVNMLELFESSAQMTTAKELPNDSKLPLGRKVEAPAPGSGKEGRKNRRMNAAEQRARIGNYAFEQIRI